MFIIGFNDLFFKKIDKNNIRLVIMDSIRIESMIDIITILTLVKICNMSDKILIIFIYLMVLYYINDK
jgi:hypothetical protein